MTRACHILNRYGLLYPFCTVSLSLLLLLGTGLPVAAQGPSKNADPKSPAPVQTPAAQKPVAGQATAPEAQTLAPLTPAGPASNTPAPAKYSTPELPPQTVEDTVELLSPQGETKAAAADKLLEKPGPKPVGAIVIFPVVTRNHKAFGDMAVLFSDELATELAKKAKHTRVHNPVYTVEEIKAQGLDSVYQKIMDYYVRAHRPEPKATQFLLEQLKDAFGGTAIERVVFVESDFDVNYMTKATRIEDRIKQWTTDGVPKDSSYYIHTRIQIFDTLQPEMPMIWANTWNGTVHGDQFNNVTPSVFQDNDSRMVFARTSRWMTREILVTMPKHIYQHPVGKSTGTQVQGEVLH